jgi:hypothetical protein
MPTETSTKKGWGWKTWTLCVLFFALVFLGVRFFFAKIRKLRAIRNKNNGGDNGGGFTQQQTRSSDPSTEDEPVASWDNPADDRVDEI